MAENHGLQLTDRESNHQIIKALSSNALGAFSYGIFQYGISFMLLHATKSPLSFGMGLTIAPLVSLLTFIPIGNFVDTHDHKRIIFWGYLLRIIGFVLLGVALPFFSGTGLLIPVALFIVLDSFLVNFRNTAYSASIRQFVNESQIPKLSSLTTACASASRVLAPVFGVLLYSLISVNGLIALEIVATIIAMIIMMHLHFHNVDGHQTPRKKVSQTQQFHETLRYMKKRPFIRDTIIAEIVVNFFYTAVVTGAPFIIVNELNLGNDVVATIETGYAIGYLLGSLITNWFKNQRHFAKRVLVSLGLVGVALTGLGALFAVAPNKLMIGIMGLLLALLLDLAFAIFDLAVEIRLQSTVPTRILGRVSSTLYTASFAIMPVGTIIYTGLFDFFEHGSYILVLSGLVLIAYAFFSIDVFSRDIKKDDRFIQRHSD
ncbi:MFS transporter [Nicoliella spurrieriana]|uniref:MFS transporter n=1 Tax=Nicoliella spurrieriana TaxID=2925830 RepID=A0A976X5M8_9LACO|nr:MFS transporter [Nicoliella spurrieriana]UQS86881.1 MFS transporter [Nicoliella spurrieriana]